MHLWYGYFHSGLIMLIASLIYTSTVSVDVASSSSRDWVDYFTLAFSFINIALIVVGFIYAFSLWRKQQNRIKISSTAEGMLFALIDFEQVIAQARHLGRYDVEQDLNLIYNCLLYTSPSPRDRQKSRMPSSA